MYDAVEFYVILKFCQRSLLCPLIFQCLSSIFVLLPFFICVKPCRILGNANFLSNQGIHTLSLVHSLILAIMLQFIELNVAVGVTVY